MSNCTFLKPNLMKIRPALCPTPFFSAATTASSAPHRTYVHQCYHLYCGLDNSSMVLALTHKANSCKSKSCMCKA